MCEARRALPRDSGCVSRVRLCPVSAPDTHAHYYFTHSSRGPDIPAVRLYATESGAERTASAATEQATRRHAPLRSRQTRTGQVALIRIRSAHRSLTVTRRGTHPRLSYSRSHHDHRRTKRSIATHPRHADCVGHGRPRPSALHSGSRGADHDQSRLRPRAPSLGCPWGVHRLND